MISAIDYLSDLHTTKMSLHRAFVFRVTTTAAMNWLDAHFGIFANLELIYAPP